MTFAQNIKKRLEDPLKTFRLYQILIAVVCMVVPAILRLSDHENVYPQKVKLNDIDMLKDSIPAMVQDSVKHIKKDHLGFRLSISDYAYSYNSYLFGMLLCIAAMLFIFNGAIYFKNQYTLKVNSKGKWYNVVLGLSLFGVICFPSRDFTFLHYTFASVFFFGNAVVIGLFHNKKDRIKSIVMSVLTVVFLLLSLVLKPLTLLWGEWLSLIVIALHFILESKFVKLKAR